jgi:hypothetical protein
VDGAISSHRCSGADPESQMDENLVRMKSFIEAGDVPSDATWQHA